MMSTGVNLVMTVIGFAVSTMFIVFVCTRLICARIQLNASRRSFSVASRSDLNILERGLHGLEPLVVANFPTKKYSDPYFSSADDGQCTICLAEYHADDTLRILPFCGHQFHSTCIDIWLQQHSTCPVCRISLRELPDKKRLMQPMFSTAVRSHYPTELYGLSSRMHNGRRMDDHHFPSNGGDGSDARESDTGPLPLKELGNKRVESPSNLQTN
jgi:hypothetical protein